MTVNPYFKNCFVCSDQNQIGLHLKNTYVDGKSHMELDVNENLSGISGLMHGGFTCMLLDEVMYYAIEALCVSTLTLNMQVDFISPAILGHHLVAEAWITNRDGRKIYAASKITDGDKIVASAEGFYITVDMDVFLKNIE